MNTTVPHNTPSARAVVSSKAGGMAQMDLFGQAVIASPAPAATPPASSRRTCCPIEVSGEPYGATADLPTLIVDGIRNTERLQS